MLPQTGRYTAARAQIVHAASPYLPPGLTALPAADLEDAMYASAGMRPWARDPIDFKILSDVAEGRGHIVDSEAESSGYPSYRATRKPFQPEDWHFPELVPKAGWASLAARPPGA